MKEDLKNKAILLRKRGHSLREIALMLSVSKSTVSLWVRDLQLNKEAEKRLLSLTNLARLRAIETNKFKKEAILSEIFLKVERDIGLVKRNIILDKIFCSLLFWGEGSKSGSDLRITNSDPEFIRLFLMLLRASFSIDEGKFRAVLHLHQYHNIKNQKQYWSKITNLPVKLFQVYIKKNTGKNKKENYQGCLSLRYYDYKIAIELKNYYQIFSKNMRD